MLQPYDFTAIGYSDEQCSTFFRVKECRDGLNNHRTQVAVYLVLTEIPPYRRLELEISAFALCDKDRNRYLLRIALQGAFYTTEKPSCKIRVPFRNIIAHARDFHARYGILYTSIAGQDDTTQPWL